MAEASQNMHTLSRLDDALKSVEKERVRCDIRLSHLELQGKDCKDTTIVRDMLLKVEHWIEGRIAILIKSHPAYPWFSRVQGVGPENIAKCLAPIRITPQQGYRKNKETKKVEVVDLPYAETISAVWMFSGVGLDQDHHAIKPPPGQTLPYNAELRTMWWRLASSLLKAGLRQKCSVCGQLVGQKATKDGSPKKHGCKGAEFATIATSQFSRYYLEQKQREVEQYHNKGWKIVPATELPKNKEGKKVEPDGMVSEGHVHARAQRKMIKVFQGCLFLVWRAAEGLPPTKPYAIDKLGHNSLIDPWKMVDR